jgi:hypothetical protein
VECTALFFSAAAVFLRHHDVLQVLYKPETQTGNFQLRRFKTFVWCLPPSVG